MFHNQNHNPFDDLQKIANSNAGVNYEPQYQKEAGLMEEVNPHFAQGMNEEFEKIAQEQKQKKQQQQQQQRQQQPAPTTKNKKKKKTSPTDRAMDKAKKGITQAGNKAAREMEKDDTQRLTRSLLGN